MTRRLIACDLEATCWEDPARRMTQTEETEIIEIGAVDLCPRTYRPQATFNALVSPQRHPTLSEYCLRLTGIRQEEVDAADPFAEVWSAFHAWLGDLDRVDFYAWGDFDHRQLVRQVEALDQPSPSWASFDIRGEFQAWCRDHDQRHQRVGLAGALELLGCPPLEQAHRALHDAHGVGQVLASVRDPAGISPGSQTLWALIAERSPSATHRGHARAELGMDKAAYMRSQRELARVGLVELLGDGQGMRARTFPDPSTE